MVTGQTVVNENRSADQSGAVVLQHCTADLRLHLSVCRRVHHLQHVLHHRRATDPRAGPAAGRRRQPPSGVPLGPRRGGNRGFVSSAVGIGLGVLAALGLKALISGFGITLPPGPLVFEAAHRRRRARRRIGVTVVAAIGPARRAVRIPPVAALTDPWPKPPSLASTAARVGRGPVRRRRGPARRRPERAGHRCLSALGALGSSSASPCSPLPSRGRCPARSAARSRGCSGMPGKLGRENSMRSPRRTAQTASALMVGLALVSAMSVFGASISRSATSSVDQAIKADLIVTAQPARTADSVAGTLAERPRSRRHRGDDRLRRPVRGARPLESLTA